MALNSICSFLFPSCAIPSYDPLSFLDETREISLEGLSSITEEDSPLASYKSLLTNCIYIEELFIQGHPELRGDKDYEAVYSLLYRSEHGKKFEYFLSTRIHGEHAPTPVLIAKHYESLEARKEFINHLAESLFFFLAEKSSLSPLHFFSIIWKQGKARLPTIDKSSCIKATLLLFDAAYASLSGNSKKDFLYVYIAPFRSEKKSWTWNVDTEFVYLNTACSLDSGEPVIGFLFSSQLIACFHRLLDRTEVVQPTLDVLFWLIERIEVHLGEHFYIPREPFSDAWAGKTPTPDQIAAMFSAYYGGFRGWLASHEIEEEELLSVAMQLYPKLATLDAPPTSIEAVPIPILFRSVDAALYLKTEHSLAFVTDHVELETFSITSSLARTEAEKVALDAVLRFEKAMWKVSAHTFTYFQQEIFRINEGFPGFTDAFNAAFARANAIEEKYLPLIPLRLSSSDTDQTLRVSFYEAFSKVVIDKLRITSSEWDTLDAFLSKTALRSTSSARYLAATNSKWISKNRLSLGVSAFLTSLHDSRSAKATLDPYDYTPTRREKELPLSPVSILNALLHLASVKNEPSELANPLVAKLPDKLRSELEKALDAAEMRIRFHIIRAPDKWKDPSVLAKIIALRERVLKGSQEAPAASS